MIAEIPPPAYHESNTGNCSIRLREKILIRISHAISGGHRVAMASLFIGHRLLHQPFEKTMGLTCAIHTEPASLAFASLISHSDAPHASYARVFPVCTVAKIVLAQLLVTWRG